MGVDLRQLSLRYGCFGAEPWSEAMRARPRGEIRHQGAWTPTACPRSSGPGVASECHEAQRRPAPLGGPFPVRGDRSRHDGEPLPAGETGELVLTTLTKEALPMMRYRTRDITRLIEEPCVCGRTHRRMMRVTGRTDDMLIIRGVNVYPSQVEAILVGFPGLAPHYQLVLTRDGPMDAMTIEVELATPCPARRAVRREDWPTTCATTSSRWSA